MFCGSFIDHKENNMNNFGLSNNQLIEMAPAVGATEPMAGASDRYSFVPTTSAIDLLRDCGWLPQHVKQSSTRVSGRDGYQKHIIRFSMGELDMGAERVDLLLVNSHNRGSAFELLASIWRKICGNGLLSAAQIFSFKHKHINFNPEDFMASAQKIAENAGQLACHVDEMKQIELLPAERTIFANTVHEYVYQDAKLPPIQPEQLLEERRYDDDGNDLWPTFNVVQENLVKGGLRGFGKNRHGRTIKKTTRAVKSLDRDIKLNKALWSMAEQMGELKAAA